MTAQLDTHGKWSKKEPRTVSHMVRQLVKIMDASGKSYGEIAKKAGVHRVTISRWKSGAASPLLSDMENVAQAMGYEITFRPIQTVREAA